MQVNHIANFVFLMLLFATALVLFFIYSHWKTSYTLTHRVNEMFAEKEEEESKKRSESLTISHYNGHCPRKCENNTQNTCMKVSFFLSLFVFLVQAKKQKKITHAVKLADWHFMMIIWTVCNFITNTYNAHCTHTLTQLSLVFARSVKVFLQSGFICIPLNNKKKCRKTRPILFVSLNKCYFTIQKLQEERQKARKKRHTATTIEIKLRARMICAHACPE